MQLSEIPPLFSDDLDEGHGVTLTGTKMTRSQSWLGIMIERDEGV